MDSLQAPRGSGRAPFIVFLMVAAVAATMVLVGVSGLGWFVALLVPALALTIYIVLNTVRVMLADRAARRERKEEESLRD